MVRQIGGGMENVKYIKLDLIFMDPCIVDDSAEIPTRCSFVIEFIIPKHINQRLQIQFRAPDDERYAA